MDTIKNYLEAMFASMPNTPEVWKAKNELFQMMEDKYNELISEGKSDNEAVGTVISEFGNLEEIADDLGIQGTVQEVVQDIPNANRHMVSMEEVKQYLEDENKYYLKIGVGIVLFIISVLFPIWMDLLPISDGYGAIGMFLCVGAGVGFIIYANSDVEKWKFLRKESCSIDFATSNFLKDEKARNHKHYSLMNTIGIVLCVICWIPTVFIDILNETVSWGTGKIDTLNKLQINDMIRNINESLAVSVLFVMVAIGVFLIVYGSNSKGIYDKLLRLNDRNTISGAYGRQGYENSYNRYVPVSDGNNSADENMNSGSTTWNSNAENAYSYIPQESEYSSPVVENIMSVYWPTVTCLYLIWSFVTFDWWISWIIWPTAAIVHAIIKGSNKK